MLRRVILAALLSLATALTLSPAAHAATPRKVACPTSYECIWVYYNNAQHATETGTMVINCSGVEYKSGTTTSYYSYDQDACTDGR